MSSSSKIREAAAAAASQQQQQECSSSKGWVDTPSTLQPIWGSAPVASKQLLPLEGGPGPTTGGSLRGIEVREGGDDLSWVMALETDRGRTSQVETRGLIEDSPAPCRDLGRRKAKKTSRGYRAACLKLANGLLGTAACPPLVAASPGLSQKARCLGRRSDSQALLALKPAEGLRKGDRRKKTGERAEETGGEAQLPPSGSRHAPLASLPRPPPSLRLSLKLQGAPVKQQAPPFFCMQSSSPSLQLHTLGEEPAGPSPTVSVEDTLNHQRRVAEIFREVWNRIQVLFGGPLRGPALAPVAPGQVQGPPGGGGPPPPPPQASAPTAADQVARRSDYILEKRKEMEAALANWMALLEGGEAVSPAEKEVAEQQGLATVRFLSKLLAMRLRQFTEAFYKAHPPNPVLSGHHRTPSDLVDLVPLLHRVNLAVEAEAEAQQEAAAAGHQLAPSEAAALGNRKLQALLALRSEARRNLRLARLRVSVLHEASWALKPGDKLKAQLDAQQAHWLEQQEKAGDAIKHCKLLGLKVGDRQRPLPQPQPPQAEETLPAPNPVPAQQPQAPATPPPQPPAHHLLSPTAPSATLPPPAAAGAASTTEFPLASRPPATTLLPAAPQIPQVPLSPTQPPQQPAPPQPPTNPAESYRGRVSALARIFGGDSSNMQQQQQPSDQRPPGANSLRPTDVRLLRRPDTDF
ncbi:hypothetical protein Esti_003143 [Eimeria stiedai]